jgi:hypothetical protein
VGNEKTALMFEGIDKKLEQIFKTKFPKEAFSSKDFTKNSNDLVLLKALRELGFNVEKVRI